jgi:chemotaxis protein methyltransferase CheR
MDGARLPAGGEGDYPVFIKMTSPVLSVDLTDYKQARMERRVRDMAHRCLAPDLETFAVMLRRDTDLRHRFEQHITINVSRFYRNPEAFDFLASTILPQLPNRRSPKVWSAGCSHGAEAFTLAMLLHRLSPAGHGHVLATDIDRPMLDRARLAKGYIPAETGDLPRDLADRYLESEDASQAVTDVIRRMVRFDCHDLLREPMPHSFDLVVCRNVVIYFTDQAKIRLYRKFMDVLHPGGFLFLGATESIGRAQDPGFRYVRPCFYRKPVS